MSRRTTLRPSDEPMAELSSPVVLPRPAPPPPETGIPRIGLLAGALTVVGAFTVGGLLLASGSGPAREPAPPTPMVALVAMAPVATVATTSCPVVTSFVDVITSYERQARWGLATSTAQTALRTPGLCEADRAALGQKLVALSREALFEQPPAPEDAPGQRRVATAYADLKTLANEYGVQPPPPLPIARSAYDSRLFLLATVAYADAFTKGDSSADDREVVRADYTAQYNLGRIWSQRSDSAQRQEGLARLATACSIAEREQLGSPDACNELQALLGPRSRWPVPLADPLIDTLPPTAAPASGR